MTKVWLDTINLDIVHEAYKKGLCYGVTTNPAILSKSENVKQTLKNLLAFQDGPVAVQVTAMKGGQMIQEGQAIAEFSSRLIVKIPVNEEGFIAIKELSKKGCSVMATAVLTPLQALLAIQAGATYLAPYFSHMEKEAFEKMLILSKDKIKLVVASIKKVEDILDIALSEVDFITIKDEIFKKLIADHEPAQNLTQKINDQWFDQYTNSIKEHL